MTCLFAGIVGYSAAARVMLFSRFIIARGSYWLSEWVWLGIGINLIWLKYLSVSDGRRPSQWRGSSRLAPTLSLIKGIESQLAYRFPATQRRDGGGWSGQALMKRARREFMVSWCSSFSGGGGSPRPLRSLAV